MINNRLVITSPKATKQDVMLSVNNEVNNETVLGYIGNSPIYNSPKTMQDLNTTSSILKKLDVSHMKSGTMSEKTSPNSKKSNLLKTRANLKNITSSSATTIPSAPAKKNPASSSLLLSPKSPQRSFLQTSQNRLNTIRSELSEVISDASPRISTSK